MGDIVNPTTGSMLGFGFPGTHEKLKCWSIVAK